MLWDTALSSLLPEHQQISFLNFFNGMNTQKGSLSLITFAAFSFSWLVFILYTQFPNKTKRDAHFTLRPSSLSGISTIPSKTFPYREYIRNFFLRSTSIQLFVRRRFHYTYFPIPSFADPLSIFILFPFVATRKSSTASPGALRGMI